MVVVSASNMIAWCPITTIAVWVAGTIMVPMVAMMDAIVVFVAQTITCIVHKRIL
jgi:hypothetical protein